MPGKTCVLKIAMRELFRFKREVLYLSAYCHESEWDISEFK